MINRALIVIAAFLACSAAANAQAVPSSAILGSTATAMPSCPGGNGIHISASSGTLTEGSSGTNTVIGLGQSVDTTLVFDISRKTWDRTNIAAAISIGLSDEEKGRYAICAGVTALLPSATLTISGARGRVHFAASLKELTDALHFSGRVQ